MTLRWAGYKVHLTERCDADLPHLITNVETTIATTPTDAKRRCISIRLCEQYEALQQRCKRQRTESFEEYAKRASVEGTMSQGVRR